MQRLRLRGDFLAAAKGPRAATTAFVLQARCRDDDGPPRLGLTVSRKVGTAVERNRARRRLREMVRHADVKAMTPGFDYVVVARRAALTHPFDRLLTEFSGALRRAGKAAGPKKSAGQKKAAGQTGPRPEPSPTQAPSPERARGAAASRTPG